MARTEPASPPSRSFSACWCTVPAASRAEADTVHGRMTLQGGGPLAGAAGSDRGTCLVDWRSSLAVCAKKHREREQLAPIEHMLVLYVEGCKRSSNTLWAKVHASPRGHSAPERTTGQTEAWWVRGSRLRERGANTARVGRLGIGGVSSCWAVISICGVLQSRAR
jgi:hypothetical protein